MLIGPRPLPPSAIQDGQDLIAELAPFPAALVFRLAANPAALARVPIGGTFPTRVILDFLFLGRGEQMDLIRPLPRGMDSFIATTSSLDQTPVPFPRPQLPRP